MDAWGGEDAHRVLVVIDAGKELSYTALDWTLDHVLQPGDALKLLGVLHQMSTSNKAGFQAGLSKLGYKSWTDEKGWNGVNRTVLDSELVTKKQLLQSNLDLHLRCQKLGITLDIDVLIARDLKCLVVEVAKNFGAHHVVLDRSMKKDKKYYIDNLTCYVTRVKTNDSCQALRPGLHPDMMTISRPISPDLGGLPQVNVERRPSYRRSSASLFMTGGDSDSLQDEGDVLESEVEEGDQAIPTSRINPNNLRQDLIAVRQWLEDQGSPEPGNMYSREESLQLSASPRSDIVSPSATEDSGGFSRAKETTLQQETQTETAANSCMSPLSDDSPTGTSSVTHSAELVRPPPASNARAASNTRAWDAEAVDPRNGNSTSRAQPGPISVQPRRVDASWTLQNLNELLNGDVGSYGLQEKKVKEGKAKAMPVAKLSTSKSTPTLPSAAQFKGRSPVQQVQQVQQQPLPVGDTRSSAVRRGTFLKKNGPVAPPLCTVCKHKTPEFGKAVRRFSYAELLYATDNFNHHNYLAQGGYGSVYRGILPEGQLIAVKQHKIASNQGDDEFCAEVEVLSCAQHRNLVTLIGYCVENGRRLLVYEYVCNGSLDRHLSAKNRECLPWKYRQKIALGSARALRYLHEECRVGCIVHRDMRPNNILLTHDFTPMVGDFGLARRQMHGDMAEETRVLGTLGYLAPEYAETGQITEKADVYAFGVVLLEIITGRKAVWPSQQGGKNGVLLTDWARELLDRPNLELVDPRLRGTECSDNNLFEMHCMMHAARQCIKKDPGMRPRMAQVLRILDPQQDGEGIYGLGGMGGRKITPDQLPAYNNPAAQQPAPPSPGAFDTDTTTATNTTSAPSPISSSSSSSKPSKNKPFKGPFKNKSMFKTSRSSSAPRLSYDEQRNLEDEEDGFREGVLLSYNTMLEFV